MNKMSFPKIEGYVVTEKLGSGSYSTVYKAYTQVGARSIVAIKCVDKSRIKNSGSAVDNLITEIRLLKTLTHPHIVHMKHFTWDDRNIYIIMEFCCGGDLSKYIHRYGRVPEKQVLYFLQQLASALKFLRETGVVHMDLKPHNLLLHKGSDGKYILKVADFGFAQYMSSSWRRCVRGSPLYMAPEMLRGEYDARVDLWSVGVIMYECLFGRAPYSSNTFKELVDKIQAQAPIQIPRGSSISPECLDLLTRLLQHDPGRRITYEEFFAHEYLDLEHMPNKENYEKAVTLIKQAIELDSVGNLQEAFVHYRDSLRYLVPAVSAETDTVRKSALTAKLTRYMERAEEIKQFVRGGEGFAPATPAPAAPAPAPAPAPQRRPARAPACCAARPHTNSIDEFDQVRHNICAKCNCIAGQSDSTISGCSCGTPSQIGGPQDAGGGPDEVKEEQPAKQSVGVADVGKSNMRSALRRMFTRHPSMPYLTNNDSSITDNAEKPGKEKVPASEAANEVCRIT